MFPDGEEVTEEEAAPPVKKETPPPVQYNYKNLLQEHVVKQGWTLPTYQTSKCVGGFSSVVSSAVFLLFVLFLLELLLIVLFLL